MDDFLLIAKIMAVYNSKGYLLLESYSDFLERFFKLKNVFIEFFGNVKEFTVEDISILDENIIIKFKGINSSGDAEIFLTKDVFVDKQNSIKLEKDSYFIHDIIGSRVFRGNEFLGQVKDVMILPANDVYVVTDIDNKIILVPAIKDYIKDFNVELKKIYLVPNCDLLYDDED